MRKQTYLDKDMIQPLLHPHQNLSENHSRPHDVTWLSPYQCVQMLQKGYQLRQFPIVLVDKPALYRDTILELQTRRRTVNKRISLLALILEHHNNENETLHANKWIIIKLFEK